MVSQLPKPQCHDANGKRCNQTQPILLSGRPFCHITCNNRCAAWWCAARFNRDITHWLRNTSEHHTASEFGCSQEFIARITYLASQDAELAGTTCAPSAAKFRLIFMSFQCFKQCLLFACVNSCTRFFDSDMPDNCS